MTLYNRIQNIWILVRTASPRRSKQIEGGGSDGGGRGGGRKIGGQQIGGQWNGEWWISRLEGGGSAD
jgi:hypothetical protein